MATVTKFLPFDVSSDANFDAIGAGMYDAIVNTMGWVEKLDTGRADWASNPARPSAGNYLWNIYGPNDALQTGSSVYYVKIEIGLTSSSQPQFRFSLGTGTNGSGTLTGYIIGPYAINDSTIGHSGNLGANGWECRFSGNTGRLGFIMFRNSGANTPMSVFVERTLNTDGTPNGNGVTLVACGRFGSSPASVQRTLMFGLGLGVEHNGGGNNGSLAIIYIQPNPAEAGGKLPISPVFPDYGKFLNPMTVCASMRTSDCPEGAILQTTLYGATRTYFASGAGQLNAFGAAGLSWRCLMRYD
jgi:hypothetical protein